MIYTASIESLNYHADTSLYFKSIAHLFGAVWLDSGNIEDSVTSVDATNRYDIISALPLEWFSLDQCDFSDQTIQEMTTWFNAHQITVDGTLSVTYPFTGGVIAAFGYPLGLAKHQTPSVKKDVFERFPSFAAGVYSWCIVQDHERKECHFITIDDLYNQDTMPSPSLFKSAVDNSDYSYSCSAMTPQEEKNDYANNLDRIKTYIENGDCYQINYTQQYTGRYSGAPFGMYQNLRKVAQAPFSVFWNLGDHHILSVSPERFLQMNKTTIKTSPIKGTAARDKDPEKDFYQKDALSQCEKNRAENIMIVDLLRNDLSQFCQPNSVKVSQLCEIRTFETVHHLVSHIEGELTPGFSHFEAFIGCFPGGSITGAPKKRAIEIIEELESHSRQIYCGSIAYFSANGHTDSNICIRTFLCDDRNIATWAGGGITTESNNEQEYQECDDKIMKLITALVNNN
jgi:para-aminobenzoate synthetase component I